MLYQPQNAFVKNFKVEFKKSRNLLVYEGVTQREASKKEREKLNELSPDESQSWFDVSTYVKAVFKNERLVDYTINIVESF